MRHRRPWLLIVVALGLAACQPGTVFPGPTRTPPATATPAPPTPILQCTPPLCAPGEAYFCASGNCPGGCGTGCATFTPPAGATPAPVCTPPPCWSGEAYFCPGECPGGCGTTCATHTPDPSGPPPPEFPDPAGVCALPPVAGTDPALAVCAGAAAVAVGGTVQVRAELVNSAEARPEFRLQGEDADGGGFFGVEARGENQVRGLFNFSDRISLRAVQADGGRLILTLEARAPGAVTIRLSAAPPFPAVYAEPLTITIQAP